VKKLRGGKVIDYEVDVIVVTKYKTYIKAVSPEAAEQIHNDLETIQHQIDDSKEWFEVLFSKVVDVRRHIENQEKV